MPLKFELNLWRVFIFSGLGLENFLFLKIIRCRLAFTRPSRRTPQYLRERERERKNHGVDALFRTFPCDKTMPDQRA